jgi:hypothetical protein
MKTVLTFGSSWPLAPLDKPKQEKDVQEAIIFGNHKGAVKQQDLLIKLVKDNVTRGFTLPLPLNKNCVDPRRPSCPSEHPSAKYNKQTG